MNNNDTWLERDVLADNEKRFGKSHYSEFNEIENAISMLDVFEYNEKKKNHFKSINDTYWGIEWDEFKTFLTERGFELVLIDNFNNRGTKEEFCIWAHKDKGLLIQATSYGGDSINDGTCYGQATRNDHFDKFFPISATCGYNKYDAAEWNIDVREGLVSKLTKIEADMNLLPKWFNTPFLYLVDYEQSKIEGYDYKEITRERLSRCPEWVREMIGISQ